MSAKMLAVKVASLCLSASVVVAMVGNYPSPQLLTSADESDCILQVNATQDEVRRIENGDLPRTDGQYCLLTCLWKKTHVMTAKGEFSPKNAAEFLRMKFEIPDRRMVYVLGPIESCLKKAKKSSDKCYLGGYMYKCMTEHRREILHIPYLKIPTGWMHKETPFEKI